MSIEFNQTGVKWLNIKITVLKVHDKKNWKKKNQRSVSWNFALFIGCSLLRFQSGVHLGAKTDEKKQRYIQVTRIKTEDEMKMKEQEKQSAELVSV